MKWYSHFGKPLSSLSYKHTRITQLSDFTPRRRENLCPHQDLCMNVHETFINNAPNDSSNVFNNRTDKRRRVHIYHGILLSHENEIMPFAATWLDLEIIIPKWGASDGKRQIYEVTNMWTLIKTIQRDLQNRNRVKDFETKFMVTKGEIWGGRDKFGDLDWHIYTTIHKINR